jgi:hypothetical protein
MWATIWNSTYNETYATWAYNMTGNLSLNYNMSNTKYFYNMSDGSYNITYANWNKTYADTLYSPSASSNLFLYKTGPQTLAAADVWYNVTWNDTDATINTGFTHSKDTNPDEITVINTGTYLIAYSLTTYFNGELYLMNARAMDDGVEIPGSYQAHVRDYFIPDAHTFLATIGAGSVIKLQAGTSQGGTSIANADMAGMPDPTTRPSASIAITRVG